MKEITELEKDLLREVVNIGLAKAADSLAIIARQRVLMEAPIIEILDKAELNSMLKRFGDADLIVFSQLVGDIHGSTLLLFHKSQIKHLCEVCLDKMFTGEDDKRMQMSLMMEISNILTGALVTQLANLLHLKLFGSPPKPSSQSIDLLTGKTLEELEGSQSLVFLINTQFINSDRRVELPLMVVLEEKSLQHIVTIFRKMGLNSSKLLLNNG